MGSSPRSPFGGRRAAILAGRRSARPNAARRRSNGSPDLAVLQPAAWGTRRHRSPGCGCSSWPTGVAGPYAGRLLAMLGATVVKVEPAGGDPARTKPVDDEPLTGTSPLYLHLNAGKLNASAAAVAAADVGRGDRRPRARRGGRHRPSTRTGRRAAAGVGHPVRVRRPTTPAASSTTCWPRPAAGIIGVQGDPGREPLRLPGWQAQYHAGTIAAVGGARRRCACRASATSTSSWTACLMTGVRAALRRRHRRRAPVAADRPVPDHRVPGRGAAVPRRLRRAGQLPRRRLGDAVPAVRPARADRRRALPRPGRRAPSGSTRSGS